MERCAEVAFSDHQNAEKNIRKAHNKQAQN